MSIIRENTIIEKCKDIITNYNNGGLSLDDVLTEVNADGLGRWVNGMLIVKSNDFHNGNNLKTSIERVVTTNSLYLCST